MHAMVIDEFGDAGALRFRQVPDPVAGEGEVVISVRAVGINPGLDFVVRAGRYARPVSLPHILGIDPSGVVEAIGAGVDGAAAGDRVWVEYLIGCGACAHCKAGRSVACSDNQMVGVNRWGGYAEKLAVPASVLVKVPDNLDFVSATVVARHAPTAMFLIEDQAKVRPGEWVFVPGATGGLGFACVQIARLAGAKVICGVGSDAKRQLLEAQGFEHVIDYGNQSDVQAALKAITSGRGVDVVCDNVANPFVWEQALAAMAKNGRVVMSGARDGRALSLDPRTLYLKRISILGGMGVAADGVRRAFELAASGAFKLLPITTFPLSQAAKAHALIESRQMDGKVVLVPDTLI